MSRVKSEFASARESVAIALAPLGATLHPVKKGQESRTAIIVCAGRALADGRTSVTRFSDPTALTLLPPSARAEVERMRTNAPPKTPREGFTRGFAARRSKMMIARTVTIDDAIREAAHAQVVILGAGLDGRAFRMNELAHATVFEVDHPDSQKTKRERSKPLTARAREVRFVPVDFERDDLARALESAGHDASKPTTWVWEGVVMYLRPADVAATLAIVRDRSAPESRLVIAYHSPAAMLHVIGFLVRLLGEPLRSTYTPESMAALLRAHGFGVATDRGLPELGAALGPEVDQATKVMRHTRIVVATRRG